MARRTTKRPLPDLLTSLEEMRGHAHPVDYLNALASRRGHWATVRGLDLARLDDMFAAARQTVLGLGRDELYGAVAYASIVRTPDGPDVELHQHQPLYYVEECIRGRDLLVVDTETTGLHYRDGDRVLSLAVVEARVRGTIDYPEEGGIPFIPKGENRLHLKATREWHCNPEGRASTPEAAAVHGLDPATLRICRPFRVQAAEIHRVLSQGRHVLVMHNAPFDMGFLRAEFARAGLPPPSNQVIDTRAASKSVWPEESASLDAMASRLGVEGRRPGDPHSALGDALLLSRCLPPLYYAVARTMELQAEEQRQLEAKRNARTRRRK